jgi:hypothetical protein
VCGEGPAADATHAPQPEGLLDTSVMKMKKMKIFLFFQFNGAQVE